MFPPSRVNAVVNLTSKIKRQGRWERNVEIVFRAYLGEKWIDLHEANVKIILANSTHTIGNTFLWITQKWRTDHHFSVLLGIPIVLQVSYCMILKIRCCPWLFLSFCRRKLDRNTAIFANILPILVPLAFIYQHIYVHCISIRCCLCSCGMCHSAFAMIFTIWW